MVSKPDFKKMTLDEQLAAYNDMSETKRKSKFKNVAQGAAALEAEWERTHKAESASNGEAKARSPKDADKKIKVLVKENPRREGSKGRDYFDTLAKSKTVGDYLANYSDPIEARDARLWMNANIKAGHVQLVE